MKYLILFLVCSLAILSCEEGNDDPKEDYVLKNDVYDNTMNRVFVGHFNTGMEGAVTLGPVQGKSTLKNLRFLFGKNSGSEQFDIKIKIYKGSNFADPGQEIFSKDYSLNSSSSDFLTVDMSGEGVSIDSGNFRVSFEFMHDGLPALGFDQDDPPAADRNWIKDGAGVWKSHEDLNVPGNYIVRATMTPMD